MTAIAPSPVVANASIADISFSMLERWLYEERLCTKRLGVTPSVMVSHLRCHLSCGQTVAQRWEISQELARVANGLRQYRINAEADNNEEDDISLGDMRSAQVFQK